MNEAPKYKVEVKEQFINVELEGCTVRIARDCFNQGYYVDVWPPEDTGLSSEPVATLEVSDAQIQEDLEHFSYEVFIKATITKSIVVDAINKDEAEEQAHEMFSVLNDDYDQEYDQQTIGEAELVK